MSSNKLTSVSWTSEGLRITPLEKNFLLELSLCNIIDQFLYSSKSNFFSSRYLWFWVFFMNNIAYDELHFS